MKSKLILLILPLCGLTFCTKEKNPIKQEVDPVYNSPYKTSSATSYNGRFLSSNTTRVYNNVITEFGDVIANFSSVSSPNSSSETNVAVTRVVHNDTEMASGDYNVYSKEKKQFTYDEYWKIDGANGIPSFNYKSVNFTPDWKDIIVPSVISTKKGFVITIKGVVNIKEGVISFNSGCNEKMILKDIKMGDNIVTFTPDECSILDSCSTGYFFISLKNQRVLNFYGKDFDFEKARNYIKDFTVVN